MDDYDIETEDTAAEAFARLEGEIALVRRAVQQLAAEKAEIRIPDYSDTLGEIVKRLGSAERALNMIADKPAMELTPEDMARRIDHAARRARESDAGQLRQAQGRFDNGAYELRGIVSTMRTIDEQRRHLLWAVGGGILGGCLLWSILPGAIARSLPQSWHMPEKMAAHIVGAPNVWEGGVRLMRAGSPEAYETIAAAAVMRRDNREKIAACEKAALDEDKEVPCTIRIGPPEEIETRPR